MRGVPKIRDDRLRFDDVVVGLQNRREDIVTIASPGGTLLTHTNKNGSTNCGYHEMQGRETRVLAVAPLLLYCCCCCCCIAVVPLLPPL